MKIQRLCNAVKWIAWGYLFLHLDIHLGVLNILPDWGGYLLILFALTVLGEEEKSALLLRPLGILLAVWEGIWWLAGLIGCSVENEMLIVIATVLSLYFHFQLLTNLAEIAERYDCPERERLLVLRTVRTICITVFGLLALPTPWHKSSLWETLSSGITVGIVVIHLLVAIWLCIVLFSLRRSLLERE